MTGHTACTLCHQTVFGLRPTFVCIAFAHRCIPPANFDAARLAFLCCSCNTMLRSVSGLNTFLGAVVNLRPATLSVFLSVRPQLGLYGTDFHQIWYLNIFSKICRFVKNLTRMTVLDMSTNVNPLNAELNPIRHLLALAGARHFVHVSRLRVNVRQ